MKFNLPRNSLFAVLLRSPWWISLLIGALLGLVAAALVPATYRGVAALSGFPFLVIAAMAAQRQWRLPGAARVAQVQAVAAGLAWPAFAALLTQAFEHLGAEVSPGREDGVDLVVRQRGEPMLVSARRWKSARLGVETLRTLQAAREAAGAPRALCICLGEVSETARAYASAQGITVWQAAELALALRGMPLPAAPGPR